MRYILLFLLFSFNLSAQYTVTCEKCGSEEEQLTRGSFTGIKIQKGTKPAVYLSQPVKARTKGGSVYLLDAHGVKFEAKFSDFTTLTTPAAWRAFMADCVCVVEVVKFGEQDTIAATPRLFQSTSSFTEVYSGEDPDTTSMELEKSFLKFSVSVADVDTSSIHVTEFGIGVNTDIPTVALDVVGDVKVSSTVILKGFTVATLPTGVVGMTAYVTDADTPTYLSTVIGGGSTICRVFYNGTNWISN